MSTQNETKDVVPTVAEIQPMEVVDLTGGAEATEYFRERAMAIPMEQVVPIHGSIEVVAHNVNRGAKAVLAEQPRVAMELPMSSLARVGMLGKLTLAAQYTAHRVRAFEDGRAERQQTLSATVKASHKLLFRGLQLMVDASLIPASEIANLDVKRGNAVIASACVACAALYKKYARVVAGKVPITVQQVRTATAEATELLGLVSPKGAKQNTEARDTEADLRNRMFTLVLQDYDPVHRAGVWLFGDQAEMLVPSALSINTRGPQDAVAKAKAKALKAQKAALAADLRAKKRESKKAATAQARKIAEEAKKLGDAAKRAARKGLPLPTLQGVKTESPPSAVSPTGVVEAKTG